VIKVSVYYSRKEGPEFASCSIGEVELDAALLDQPAVLAAAIRRAYDRCREAVDVQLIGTAAAVNPAPAPAPVPPAIPAQPPRPAPIAAPPSTPPVVGPPNPATKRYYDDRKQRNQDGPPTTGSQLGGVAKKLSALPWFQALGAAQTPPLPKYVGDWSDEWAVWAWAQYQAACIPPAVPVTNGVANH
jgi:hypothetical protein